MKSFAVLALAVILGPGALAQHQTFAVNPDASEVKMKLNTTHESSTAPSTYRPDQSISTKPPPIYRDR
jgi:hypothetical protein